MAPSKESLTESQADATEIRLLRENDASLRRCIGEQLEEKEAIRNLLEEIHNDNLQLRIKISELQAQIRRLQSLGKTK